MMKSTFRDIDLFGVFPYFYKAGDHLSHLFFNSVLDWLSFNNEIMKSQLKAMNPVPLISAIIRFNFDLASVYVLPCLKYAFYWP